MAPGTLRRKAYFPPWPKGLQDLTLILLPPSICPPPQIPTSLDLFPHVLVPASPLTPIVFQVLAEMSSPPESLPGPHYSYSHGSPRLLHWIIEHVWALNKYLLTRQSPNLPQLSSLLSPVP